MAESPTTDDLDAIVAALNAPMVVVTASDGRESTGCLVGFHAQCSIDPERWVVWISRANHSAPVVGRADRLAIHFLEASDRDLAVLFGATTGDTTAKLARCDVASVAGVPVLSRVANVLVGTRTTTLDDAGDHLGVVVQPIEISARSRFTPLRYQAVRDLEPGHPADDPPRI